jgi:hypothetical protein
MYTPLRRFLEARRARKGLDFTHTSLGDPLGSFYIGEAEYDEFIEVYSSALSSSGQQGVHLTERHKAMSPVLIDLDFRQDCAERIYDMTYITRFLNVLIRITIEYVDQDQITCYVLEKPAPRPNGSTIYFKDGIHVFLVDVITKPEIQHAIRADFIEKHTDVIVVTPAGAGAAPHQHMTCTDASEIYDESVIEKNNWFMYGSKKPDEEHPWGVTHAFRFFRCSSTSSAAALESRHWNPSADIQAETIEIPRELRTLVRTLSIRAGAVEESRYTSKVQTTKTHHDHLLPRPPRMTRRPPRGMAVALLPPEKRTTTTAAEYPGQY